MNLRIVGGSLARQVRRYSYKPVRRVPLPPASNATPDAKKADGFSLGKELRARIVASGPIPIATYMKQVLTNPAAGYYMTANHNVFGSRGDFITSPEIGQIFGEVLAVWSLNEWHKFGRPVPFQLIELGPGKGTMMNDILRVYGKFKVTAGLSVHLVEMSEHLSKVQAALLCRSSTEYGDKPFYRSGVTADGLKVYWYRRLEDVPQVFSIIFAHEFFDALPIHKFVKEGDSWKEVLIDVDQQNSEKFRFVASKADTPMLRLFLNSYCSESMADRNHVEISFESESVIQEIGNRLSSNGGLALIVDYGHLGDKGDTFRAFRNHKLYNPLEEPGCADLTADVDFSLLKQFCDRTGKIFTIGPTSQRAFLELAGAKERLEVLLAGASSEEERHRLTDGFRMLTDEDQMGSRFKFFALLPKELKEIYN
ncbi:protein arginine methyltransferase NDUFAF7 homolog, mitochondrial [Wyeomyia smithii]|uniref:protein arginine methyltransferase NDUFAF7 homolog, mitochondrial n=1 Tax=Wyeomyia smithii TaxID=174621 RepID=UPI002467DF8C|nr:protein arginine methyltransferase NDUFAF7 homolog, mitochondrial [Wyeomyia smithii]